MEDRLFDGAINRAIEGAVDQARHGADMATERPADRGFGIEKEEASFSGNPYPRIGWIENHFTGEKNGFNDADAYIKALQAHYDSIPDGFSCHTESKDPAVRMEADRLSYNMFGESFPRGLDDYGKFSENNRIKGYLVDKATGEKTGFYDSDEYVLCFADQLRNAKDKGSVAFFTRTDNTAVWKAVDDVIRREFELEDPHAFERCIHRPPMEKAMCVREYMLKYLGESVKAWNRESVMNSDKPAGWIRKHGNDERSCFYSADEFVKELKLELALHPDNTDFFVERDEAAIHKAVFDIVGDVCGGGNSFYLDELANDDLHAIKGRIIDYSTGEMTEFTKSEEYLEAVGERFMFRRDQFAFETLTDNSAVWKELDDTANRAFGVYERDGIESSLARPKVKGLVTLGEYMRQRIWKDTKSQKRENGEFKAKPEQMAIEYAIPMESQEGNTKEKQSKEKTGGQPMGKPAKKRSVLARLAEKQAIVWERDKAKMSRVEKRNDHKLPILSAR